VQDQEEMKSRLGELAAQLGAPKAQAEAIAKKGAESEASLNEARNFLKAGKPSEAAAAARKGLANAPDSAGLRSVLAHAEQQERQAKLTEQRKAAEAARVKAEADAARQREALAKAAEAARLKAEADAKAKTEAAKKAEEARRTAAARKLADEAKAAFDAKNFVKAVADYKSAIALSDTQELKLHEKLAQAEVERDKAARLKAEQEAAKKAEQQKKATEAAPA